MDTASSPDGPGTPESETVRIIITGGTFDKDYDPLSQTLTFGHTHLPRIMKDVRVAVPVELEINQLTDSLMMDDNQRRRVVEACAGAHESRIIITHGTDSMTVTAEWIDQERLNKTVVLTGAMIPYAVSGSDAVFNLGAAFLAVQVLQPGVYVVMNGRVFNAGRVRKNPHSGLFEHVPHP